MTKGTATTKGVNNIKEHVNQLTETQSTQQETWYTLYQFSLSQDMLHKLTGTV